MKNPLNFIRKANKSFNLILENQNRYKAFFTAFMDAYGRNQDKIDQFIKRYDEKQAKIDTSLAVFDQNYKSCKSYFFSGDEELFEKMDTDQFFQMCFFNNIKLLAHSPIEDRIYLKTEDGITLSTNHRFYTILEIFGRGGYSFHPLYQFKEFVVFDIGMNRGYAALKFANFDSCKEVYGFEINEEAYDFALENFGLNPELANKIKPHKFGLSNEDGEVDIYCLPGADGVTTTEMEFTNYQSEWMKNKDRMKTKKARVKEAGTVISNILKNINTDVKLVLKIDTEGSEYKIIDSLINEGVLEEVDLIMGEIHLESVDLDEKLVGFKNIYKKYHNSTIYSFCYIKHDL